MTTLLAQQQASHPARSPTAKMKRFFSFSQRFKRPLSSPSLLEDSSDSASSDHESVELAPASGPVVEAFEEEEEEEVVETKKTVTKLRTNSDIGENYTGLDGEVYLEKKSPRRRRRSSIAVVKERAKSIWGTLTGANDKSAFAQAGKEEGLEVWVLLNNETDGRRDFTVQSWPSTGDFSSDKVYLVLKTLKARHIRDPRNPEAKPVSESKFCYNLHLWVGKTADPRSVIAGQFKCTELCQLLDCEARRFKELERKESRLFCSYFFEDELDTTYEEQYKLHRKEDVKSLKVAAQPTKNWYRRSSQTWIVGVDSAFHDVGDKPTLDVWSVEKKNIAGKDKYVVVPWNTVGSFLPNGVYVVLNTDFVEQTAVHHIHIWKGIEAGRPLFVAGLFKCSELKKRLGNLPIPVQHEYQGKESELFKSFFGGNIVALEDDIEIDTALIEALIPPPPPPPLQKVFNKVTMQNTLPNALDEAFKNAGEEPGVEVWVVKPHKKTFVVEKHHNSNLDSTRHYIFLQTKDYGKEPRWRLYMWKGEQSPHADLVACLYKTTELKDHLGNMSLGVKQEIEGEETKEFKRMISVLEEDMEQDATEEELVGVEKEKKKEKENKEEEDELKDIQKEAEIDTPDEEDEEKQKEDVVDEPEPVEAVVVVQEKKRFSLPSTLKLYRDVNPRKEPEVVKEAEESRDPIDPVFVGIGSFGGVSVFQVKRDEIKQLQDVSSPLSSTQVYIVVSVEENELEELESFVHIYSGKKSDQTALKQAIEKAKDLRYHLQDYYGQKSKLVEEKEYAESDAFKQYNLCFINGETRKPRKSMVEALISLTKRKSTVLDPTFKECLRKTTGLFIFRIVPKHLMNGLSTYKLRKLPAIQYGEFPETDCLLIVNSFQNPGTKEKTFSTDIHVWRGCKTTDDELTMAQNKALELKMLLDEQRQRQDVVYHAVEEQFQEDPVFGDYFKAMVYLKKNEADEVEEGVMQSRLFMVRATKQVTRVFEIPCSASCLNLGDAFVLDGGDKLYQFLGPTSSRVERFRAGMMLSKIKSDRPSADIVDKPDEHFWDLLGGSMADVRQDDDPFLPFGAT